MYIYQPRSKTPNSSFLQHPPLWPPVDPAEDGLLDGIGVRLRG